MSENAGPVAEVNPTMTARAMGGKPRSIPTSRKIRAVAKPGNHPEYMAEIPTISSEEIAANAEKTSHMIRVTKLMLLMMPQSSARMKAVTK